MDFTLGPFEAVADRIHVAVAEPASVNVGLVVGTTGALVVDTGSSPEQGRAILAAARAVAAPVPVTHVLVTHAHYDHLGGLGGFDEVESIGHADIEDALAANPDLDAELAAVGLTRAGLALPRRRFHRTTVVGLGDCRVEVLHFGRGHTASDAVALVPERAVAFAGDLVEESAHPSVGPDSHLTDWPGTIDWTFSHLPASTLVVPGHGRVMSHEDVGFQGAELHWLGRRIREIYEQGTPLDRAYEASAAWLWDEPTVRALLPHVYANLAASGVVPTRTRSLPLRPL